MHNTTPVQSARLGKVEGIYEYLLVAHPDPAANNKVWEEKLNFHRKYNQKLAIKTKPHITVASFLAFEAMEETLIRYTHRICSSRQSFNVLLNNYSGFPPHAIYLRVQEPKPFHELSNALKAIDSYVQANGCPPAYLINKPHLTIARGLDDATYHKALMEYSQRTFFQSFLVDELVLLRRIDEYDACKVINIFRLQPAIKNLFN